jgi:hypothetical protein
MGEFLQTKTIDRKFGRERTMVWNWKERINMSEGDFERVMDKNAKTTGAIFHDFINDCQFGDVNTLWIKEDVAVAEHNKTIEYLSKDRERIKILYTQALGKIVDLKKERDEQKKKLQQIFESYINAYPLDNKVDSEVRKVLHKMFGELFGNVE